MSSTCLNSGAGFCTYFVGGGIILGFSAVFALLLILFHFRYKRYVVNALTSMVPFGAAEQMDMKHIWKQHDAHMQMIGNGESAPRTSSLEQVQTDFLEDNFQSRAQSFAPKSTAEGKNLTQNLRSTGLEPSQQEYFLTCRSLQQCRWMLLSFTIGCLLTGSTWCMTAASFQELRKNGDSMTPLRIFIAIWTLAGVGFGFFMYGKMYVAVHLATMIATAEKGPGWAKTVAEKQKKIFLVSIGLLSGFSVLFQCTGGVLRAKYSNDRADPNAQHQIKNAGILIAVGFFLQCILAVSCSAVMLLWMRSLHITLRRAHRKVLDPKFRRVTIVTCFVSVLLAMRGIVSILLAIDNMTDGPAAADVVDPDSSAARAALNLTFGHGWALMLFVILGEPVAGLAGVAGIVGYQLPS